MKCVPYLIFHLYLYKPRTVQNYIAGINMRCPFRTLPNSRDGRVLVNSFWSMSVKQLSTARFSKKVLKRFIQMEPRGKVNALTAFCFILFLYSRLITVCSLNNPFTEWDIILQYEEHIDQFSWLFKCSNEHFLFPIQESYCF